MKDWRKLLSLFPRRDRLRIFALLASTTLSGLLQAVGVASIMPFIAVVASPDLVTENPWLAQAYERLGFGSVNDFRIFLGVAAMGVLVVTNVLVAVNAWLTFRVCHMGEHDLSRRLLRTYLQSPWQLLLQRNSAELLKMLVSEVDRVVIRTLMAGIGVFSDVVTTLFIVALLLWISPWVTVATLAVLGVAYGLIYALVIPRVVRLGAEFPALNTETYKNAHEALAAAREIRIAGTEEHFVERFSRPLLRLSRNSIRYSTLDIIPAQALELALWFHDAVYRPGRGDNEQASAELALRWASTLGLAPALGQRAAGLILATRHEPSGAPDPDPPHAVSARAAMPDATSRGTVPPTGRRVPRDITVRT